MTRTSRCHRAVSIGAVLLVMTAMVGCSDDGGGTGAATGAGRAEPEQVSVVAGANDRQDPNIAVLEYLPESVTIAAGASVEWRITGPEPHSVTFTADGKPPTVGDPALFPPKPPTGPYDGRSLVNSGVVPLGPGEPPPFKVTFPSIGKFTYYCVIHPSMAGTVTVVDAGGKTDSQREVTARADDELNRWLEEGRAAKRKLLDAPPAVERGTDGTSTYKVGMGANTEHTSVLSFSPADATLKVGDRVTFVNNSQAPHTASFAGKTALPQDPTSPQVERPAPGPSPQTLNTTDFFNTGTLPANAGSPGSAPPEAARSFTFVVRAAGTYVYVCLLHVPSGMGGTLKVA